MIEARTLTHLEDNDDPLPPAWLRRSPTVADSDPSTRSGVLRVGPARSLHRALVETIDEAQEIVLCASFLLADDNIAAALVRAAERGARVYALTAAETRLAQIPREDSDFDARMVAEHKALLDRLVGHVLLRSAEHFHAKFIVADPWTTPRGLLTTSNFNKALQDGVELGVELDPKATKTLAEWFCWAFWVESERELERGRLRALKEPPGRPPIPTDLTSIVTTTRTHQHLRDAVLRLVAAARRRIVVASYGLVADHASVQALIARAKAGVEVTILTRPRPAVREAVQQLAAAGVRVLAHDRLHAKAIHTDAGAMIMTANLEANGLDRGFEAGVLLSKPQATALGAVLDEWSTAFPWRFAAAAQPRTHLGEIWYAERGARDPRGDLVDLVEIPLNPVIADDALALEQAPRPEFKRPHDPKKIAQRYRYTWQVHPPKLPPKATPLERVETREEKTKDGKTRQVERKIPYDPPVYRDGKRLYVLVRDSRDLKPARTLAAELKATVVVK